MLRRELPPGVVDGVGRIEDQLADGHHGVAVVDKTAEDGGQRLRRVQRGIVEQHDAPRLHLGRHPLAYRLRVVMIAHFIFCPIKTHPKSILKRSKIYPVKGVDMIRKYGIVEV